jgi:preprotein translocase subunit SecA
VVMLIKVLKKFFDRDKKDLDQMMKIVEKINELETTISALKEDELRQKTSEFRQRLANGETLDELLPEAFAVVRETSKRVLGLRHYDVQLLGGIVLHKGNIAEMKTGEGKTLVATLPAYLNALTGKGVHIYTVNDYLTKRDAEWMRPIYEFLGLTVGYVLTSSSHQERKHAYQCDITYGTSNEFGFDYLRSNLVKRKEDILQRPFHYAIVDEVDTILIDEASVPLYLSDLSDEVKQDYYDYAKFIQKLNPDVDFILEPKQTRATLTDEGIEKVERLLGIDNLYSSEHIMKVTKIQHALIAKYFFENGKDYIIQDNKIVMIDSFTGRLMPGRRFADGIQQSIEAKEGVPISPEYIVKGAITYQNLLRKYEKISGMSGTAKTEEMEFIDSYNLYVYVIPTHQPLQR